MEKKPLVSIVTPTFNSASFVERCIQSVNKQTYKNIEQIFIDGLSTDQTLECIQRTSLNYKLISEKDNGIYDAMNKGINHSKGEIVFILNSDDFFVDNEVVQDVVRFYQNNDVQIIYSNIEYFEPSNIHKTVRRWVPKPYKHGWFRFGWHPPHPGFIALRECYEKGGQFNCNLDISADFELMLRFFEVKNYKHGKLDRITVKMQNDGTSSKLKNSIIGNINVLKAFKLNKIKVFAPILFMGRVLHKFL